ncbi:MAG: type III-A CRISPR-associated RAMP protein Csm4, partial [Bacteroidetes bacterium]|nr:type III-A CRISPR-associated RAMP protein Csm4 [Bacteroidota bacterium]
MEVAIFKCRPDNPFHFGKTSLENSGDIIHSDTLFSAIVNTYHQVYPSDVENLIKAFQEGQIRISSAFHCLEYAPDQYFFFLPRPVNYQHTTGGNVKSFKKIRFFSLGIWKNLPEKEKLLNNPRLILGESYLVTVTELYQIGLHPDYLKPNEFLRDQKLVRTEMYPKVRVHASDQENVFYHQFHIQLQELQTVEEEDNPHPNKQTHFYFLLETPPDSPLTERFKQIIRLLADEGIGGERSVGCGTFRSVVFKSAVEMGFPARDEKSTQCTLSLTIPASQDDFDATEAYQLVLRGGGSLGIKGEAENHRRQIHMIAEGALAKHEVKGKM